MSVTKADISEWDLNWHTSSVQNEMYKMYKMYIWYVQNEIYRYKYHLK